MTKLDQTLTFLKEITDANAVPGQERQAREVMKKYIGEDNVLLIFGRKSMEKGVVSVLLECF